MPPAAPTNYYSRAPRRNSPRRQDDPRAPCSARHVRSKRLAARCLAGKTRSIGSWRRCDGRPPGSPKRGGSPCLGSRCSRSARSRTSGSSITAAGTRATFNQRLASYLVTEALVTGVHWFRAKAARRRAASLHGRVRHSGDGENRLLFKVLTARQLAPTFPPYVCREGSVAIRNLIQRRT